MKTREITVHDAILEALIEEMQRDETVFMIGEDIHIGTVLKTKKIWDTFGEYTLERLISTPISESGFTAAALGCAITGLRPIVEIMIADFSLCAADAICNEIAKYRYFHGGTFKVPVVIRISRAGIMGGGEFKGMLGIGAMDSQSLEATFAHFPGLKVYAASTPYDAKGLLKTAIRDDNPVISFEHKMLYRITGPVPEEEYTIPLGVADVKREGEDITIFAFELMLHRALSAAEKLSKEGISTEVLDPRTLYPLDKKAIIESVKKTGRLVIVEEDVKSYGVGAEVAAIVADEAFDYLDAPIKRLANPDLPLPSGGLERYVIPSEKDIIRTVKEIVPY